MKLWTIKFANGLYLSRLAKKDWNEKGDALTANLNEAYVYHDPEWLLRIEEDKYFAPGYYKDTMEKGGGSYELIEVKIVEA
jgi:hypothetical protein